MAELVASLVVPLATQGACQVLDRHYNGVKQREERLAADLKQTNQDYINEKEARREDKEKKDEAYEERLQKKDDEMAALKEAKSKVDERVKEAGDLRIKEANELHEKIVIVMKEKHELERQCHQRILEYEHKAASAQLRREQTVSAAWMLRKTQEDYNKADAAIVEVTEAAETFTLAFQDELRKSLIQVTMKCDTPENFEKHLSLSKQTFEDLLRKCNNALSLLRNTDHHEYRDELKSLRREELKQFQKCMCDLEVQVMTHKEMGDEAAKLLDAGDALIDALNDLNAPATRDCYLNLPSLASTPIDGASTRKALTDTTVPMKACESVEDRYEDGQRDEEEGKGEHMDDDVEKLMKMEDSNH